MKTIDLQQLSAAAKQNWLNAAIAPRPICFASSIDNNGLVNLSPFSYFNLFSVQPAVVVFSASRRVRDNTTKHTLQNVLEVPEVVINICDYDMVQQVSLSSCEYPKGTNEFVKAGFTMQPAIYIKPPMVQEAKIKFECKVLEIKSLGNMGGAGQLIIAEVLYMHVDESVLNADGNIDPFKMQHVARLGGDWYCKVEPGNLFKVKKPNVDLGIGIDGLPDSIRNSNILTGNNLGQLANVTALPNVDVAFTNEKLSHIFQYYALNPNDLEAEIHRYAKDLLDQDKTTEAWQVLLSGEVL